MMSKDGLVAIGIETLRIDNGCSLEKEFTKFIKSLASSGVYIIILFIIIFKALHQERKRRNERIIIKLTWAS